MKNAAASTIYALASAPGKAGVAVVRISGNDAGRVMEFFSCPLPAPRVATRATLTRDGEVLDEALALWFPAPRSFTGEDVLELHLHGGRAVVMGVLAVLGDCPGLRLAEPGEFSRRAFLNGKLDLAQAEGLADLIDAETQAQQRQALRQFGGEASRRLETLRNAALEPLALLEAFIDFPDEEIPPSVLSDAKARVSSLRAQITDLLGDGHIGEKIREGIEVVIFGPPNVGKSSLINALSKRDIAIVSPEPGTTRDMVEAHLNIDGYAVTLIDTAGLRSTNLSVEAEGIRRARARAKQADIRLCLLEAPQAIEQYKETESSTDTNTLIIINKTDLAKAPELPLKTHAISIQNNQGIEELIGIMKQRIHALVEQAPAPLITRLRHRQALLSAQKALERFSLNGPLELACEELRLAARDIGKITGKILTDDLLDLVFSRFCIGK